MAEAELALSALSCGNCKACAKVPNQSALSTGVAWGAEYLGAWGGVGIAMVYTSTDKSAGTSPRKLPRKLPCKLPCRRSRRLIKARRKVVFTVPKGRCKWVLISCWVSP